MALTLAGLLAAPSLGFAAAPDAVMVCPPGRQGQRIRRRQALPHPGLQGPPGECGEERDQPEEQLPGGAVRRRPVLQAGYRGRGTHRRYPQAGRLRRRRRDLRLRRRRGVRRIAGQAERPVQVGD